MQSFVNAKRKRRVGKRGANCSLPIARSDVGSAHSEVIMLDAGSISPSVTVDSHADAVDRSMITSPIDRLIGRSPAMSTVRDKLRRIAPADGSVLVTGASGTGKELVAHVVHALSPRAAGPFVAVDCGALAEG